MNISEVNQQYAYCFAVIAYLVASPFAVAQTLTTASGASFSNVARIGYASNDLTIDCSNLSYTDPITRVVYHWKVCDYGYSWGISVTDPNCHATPANPNIQCVDYQIAPVNLCPEAIHRSDGTKSDAAGTLPGLSNLVSDSSGSDHFNQVAYGRYLTRLESGTPPPFSVFDTDITYSCDFRISDVHGAVIGTLNVGGGTDGSQPAGASSKEPRNSDKGICEGSGTESNAPGVLPAPSTASNDPVDLATGYYYDTLDLIAVAAVGAPLQLTLKYSSGNPAASSIGFGWGHPYQYSLADLTSSIKVGWPDQHVSTYTANGTTGYTNSAADAADTMVKNSNGTYTLTDRRQKTYNFDATRKLVSTADRLGFVKTFSYLTNGNLDKVTDALSGRFLQFSYDSQNRVTIVNSAGAGTALLTYTAAGDLSSVTDPLGNVTAFTYDTNHRLLTKVNALGATVVTNTYDSTTGKVTRQDDGLPATPLEQFTYGTDATTGKAYTSYQNRTGGIVRQNFDARLNPISTVDPLGGTETHAYDAATGLRTSYQDPLGNQTTFAYDSSGYLLSRTDVQGHVARYTYDASHNILSITDEAGKVTTNTYGSNRQLLTKTDPSGGVTRYTYNAQGLVATATAPTGGVTSYTYDVKGQLTSEVNPAGSTISYTYDSAGRMLTRTDSDGNVWSWTYDLLGHVASNADPLGNVTRYTYDALGRIGTKTAPTGGVTRYAYDMHGNLTSLTNPLGNVTTYGYDANDNLTSMTNALGRTTTIGRDAKGRVTAVTDPLGNNIARGYNAADDVTSMRDALNRLTGLAYDSLRRVATVTDPLNNTTTLAYDAMSRVTTQTDPKGGASNFGYDALGRLVNTTNALAGRASQTFDLNGNRLTVVDANGNTTTATIDAANRVTRIATSDGGGTTYTYNNRNLVATATNGRGQTANYSYNAAGLPISITQSLSVTPLSSLRQVTAQTKIVSAGIAPPGTSVIDPSQTITYTYDANGNMLTAANSAGTASYTYDTTDRISSHTDVFGNRIAYAYDAAGNLITLTYPGNRVVTYTYDAGNRMTLATDWANRSTSYTYNARGNITATSRANGTHGAFTYNAKGQLASIAETFPSATSNYDVALTYDSNGNIVSEVITPADAALNLTTAAMTYVADNRLATLNGQAVSYDADGNMTIGRVNGAAATFTFNARSSLTAVGNSSYSYNALGDRVSTTNAGVTTRYVVDPNAIMPRVLMETTATGVPIAYYIYGQGLISRETSVGAYQTYHYDLRGSTRRLADSNGTVSDSYAYGPYGELALTTGSTTQPFKYVGRDGVMTEGNGLYYMRARYYSPEAKRFVNRDPLLGRADLPLTLNRLSYVNGNPISNVDPKGLEVWSCKRALKGLGDFQVGPISHTYLCSRNSISGEMTCGGLGPSTGGSGAFGSLGVIESDEFSASGCVKASLPNACFEACVTSAINGVTPVPTYNVLGFAESSSSVNCHSYAKSVLDRCRERCLDLSPVEALN